LILWCWFLGLRGNNELTEPGKNKSWGSQRSEFWTQLCHWRWLLGKHISLKLVFSICQRERRKSLESLVTRDSLQPQPHFRLGLFKWSCSYPFNSEKDGSFFKS
jgi:hypothetical protein